ncbi:MAG: glycosyltransferase family 4 protein [Chlorobium sp.]|jgi:glycosyltransferase involved in cell wall biosynthesis|nr:glycosyltransferase family 4 protein [Chlorobium sp.]
MAGAQRVCIIGPSVDTNYIGGVATHIRNLKTFSCFRDAVVLDPGSVHSNSKVAFLQIIKNIASLRTTINVGDFTKILINSSIYPSAFIKLLMILATLPTNEQREIHVFFHGGRFPALNKVTGAIVNFFSRPFMAKVEKFHLLSRVQLEGFTRVFPKLQAGLYANYATSDSVWQKCRGVDTTTLRLLFVGRVVREKGVFELFAAFEKILRDSRQISLTIAGDGPDLAELKKLNERLPPGAVQFLGFVTGDILKAAYQNADVLLLPSYHEGFPYVVIEAMRAGLPIVSTSSGALETLIQDGVTGFKVLPQDADSIVNALGKLIEDRALLAEMSSNCQKYFQENLSRSAAEKYYSQLLDCKGTDGLPGAL